MKNSMFVLLQLINQVEYSQTLLTNQLGLSYYTSANQQVFQVFQWSYKDMIRVIYFCFN